MSVEHQVTDPATGRDERALPVGPDELLPPTPTPVRVA